MWGWVTIMDALGIILWAIFAAAGVHVLGASIDVSILIGATWAVILHSLVWRRERR